MATVGTYLQVGPTMKVMHVAIHWNPRDGQTELTSLKESNLLRREAESVVRNSL